MAAALDVAALAVSAGALISAAVVLASTRRPGVALPVLLDLLTAAGVLRLAADPSWQRVAAAGAIIVLRHLLVYGLHAAATTSPGDGPRHASAQS